MDDQALEPWRPCKRPLRQCSSAATMGGSDYDVFLNHRGPDVKAGFMAHLDEALRAAGLNPFLDKASLRKGDPAFRCIQDALEEARIHVAVISKGYADSKYCLSELAAMMRSGKPVIPVFYDVEPMQLRRVEGGPFAEAFEKHKSKRSGEQVEEWRDALCKVADITGICFRRSDYKGDEVQLKWEVVDAILCMTPRIEELYIEHHMVGVEEHVRTCIDKLEMMSSATCILGLVGLGGVGKTSLAKEIYNYFGGVKRFQAMSFLEIDHLSTSSMEVGQSFVNRLQEQLLWDLLQIQNNNQQRYKFLFSKLSRQGPVLVVLDDLCARCQFDEVILDKSLLACGSCIIVTSRDRHLLKVIGGDLNFHLYEVLPLEFDDAQKLFNLQAFGKEEAPEKFKPLAMDVSKACGGLPLALKVVGSSLFGKRSDEDLECVWPEAVDALKKDPSIMSVLRWSYDCLLEEEKVMFVDIACVFHGWEKKEALEIWKSCKKCSCCGFTTPYTSLQNLVDKCLIVLECPGESDKLSMHGLLRELGESIGMCEGSHLWEGKARKAMEVKTQELQKVRALNLANSGRREFECKNLAKMTNLHFLVLDGCNVVGDLGSISEELRWLQWRYMPLAFIPPTLSLSNLISLDFSESTMLARTWVESDPAFEACSNLLKLDLSRCTSITTLPDSIGRLSRLQVLNLDGCEMLQKLPSPIGRLTALQDLHLGRCGKLNALPESITALSGLRSFGLSGCSSISNLPTTFGLMTSLTDCCLAIDLATEEHAVALAELNAPIRDIMVMKCIDEAIHELDRLGALRNLHHLSGFYCYQSPSMTKLPETIGLFTNLERLQLNGCEKLRKLPESIGQLKVLRAFWLIKCLSLDTLPSSLGALTQLVELSIVDCVRLTKLPTSLGQLSSLRILCIEGCFELQQLPECVRQLDALAYLTVQNCGSLEGMGVVRAVQGLRIWGCTSVTELRGSRLMVVDSNFWNPASYMNFDRHEFHFRQGSLKELQVVEVNDCGLLRLVQERDHGREMWQRVHKLSRCRLICSMDWKRQFQALRTIVQANPQMLQPMLQELGKQNPALLWLINDNQAEFLRFINEAGAEGGEGGDAMGQLAGAYPQSVDP